MCAYDESNMLILHHTNIFYAETNHLAVKYKALFDLVSQKEKKKQNKVISTHNQEKGEYQWER